MTRAPFILAAAVAVFLAGCAPQTGARESAGVDAGAPKQGGQLKLRLGTEPADFDVTYSGYCNSCSPILEQTYGTLLAFKAGPDVRFDEFILQPDIAERWEVSKDATSFTFHLRKGVKFAPVAPVNGRELTAADVKWTIEYLTRTGELKDKNLPKYAYSWMFEGLEGVETPDPYTAVVKFQEPFAPFASYAASSDNPIMPREIYEQEGSLQARMAGTGPFWHDMNASQRGARHVVKKHPDYWDTGKPYLDEIQF